MSVGPFYMEALSLLRCQVEDDNDDDDNDGTCPIRSSRSSIPVDDKPVKNPHSLPHTHPLLPPPVQPLPVASALCECVG